MKLEIVEYLRCPACRDRLELRAEDVERSRVLSGELLCQECQRSYEINYGLPNLVYPEAKELPKINAKFLKQSKRIAALYDLHVLLGQLLSGIWDPRARRLDLVAPLELEPGDRVLEVGAGTGSNLSIIGNQIGKEGELFALDLSPGMLAVAREKLKRRKIEAEFVLGNGAYLPYKDDLFDAVLHFAVLHFLGEKEQARAIAELIRVAKPSAKIVIGDEGLAPGKEKTWFSRLLKMNANKPPVEALPANVEDLNLRWIWRGTCYVMDFKKASA